MTPFEAARRNLAEQARLEPILLQAIADAEPPPLRPKGAAIDTRAGAYFVGADIQLPPWVPGRPRTRLLKVSEQRAKICVMSHDVISAGLWALAGFDPALVHFAELREHFGKLDEEHPSRVSLDRALAIYVEGQCRELIAGAGITMDEVSTQAIERISDINDTLEHILACTTDPLAIEIETYAVYLGLLTAHSDAPWKRFAAVMADCHAQLPTATFVGTDAANARVDELQSRWIS